MSDTTIALISTGIWGLVLIIVFTVTWLRTPSERSKRLQDVKDAAWDDGFFAGSSAKKEEFRKVAAKAWEEGWWDGEHDASDTKPVTENPYLKKGKQ